LPDPAAAGVAFGRGIGLFKSEDITMGMIGEFKEFAMRGNVVDLAVGVVIGAAFGKIVTALVDKVVMPPVGLLIGGVDFSKWAITLKEASVDAAGKEIPAVVLGIGDFLNTLVQFVIIAFAIFLVVKAINRMNRKEPPPPAAPSEDTLLLREIRDALKK
jgi:large conductance mechanosensitive channel